MLKRSLVVVLTALAVAAVLPGVSSGRPAASAASEWVGWRFLGTTCFIRGDTPQMRAHVKVRMNVTNSGSWDHWATNMRVKARLSSPGHGLQLGSQWRTTRYPAVSELGDGYHTKVMAVNTDGVNPGDGPWVLETKLIWDRKAPIPDYVKHFTSTFAGCSGSNDVVAR